MQAIILATDETTKLRPLTERLSGPLLPIVDRPIMARVLELLARHNQKQALVSLYRLPGDIERYCHDGRRWGVNLSYLLQREAYGSAGSLKWAEPSLKETFLVLPADVLLDLDIASALSFHRAHGSLATAILVPAGSTAPNVWVDVNGHIGALGDLSSAGASGLDGYLLSGAFLFEPDVLSLVPYRTGFDCAQDLLPRLITGTVNGKGTRLEGYIHQGYWNPLDTFAGLKEAQRVYLDNACIHLEDGKTGSCQPSVRYPSLAGLQLAPGIWAGHNLNIHPSVRLASPVYLGDNCQVGRDVELGPFTVLGKNVVVDDEATVRESIVLDGTYVGRLVNLNERVVDKTLTVDIPTGASTVIVDNFLLSETNPVNVNAALGRLADVVGALLLIILASPVLILAAVAALFSSLIAGQGARLVIRQPRVGYMPRAQAEPRQFGMLFLATRRADGTFTPLGRLLERTELDRLPALWNVLRGQLRLVGIQPLTLDQVNESVQDWQRERLAYPPGFTGLWYVQAPRTADSDTTAVADAYYIATRSWRGDLIILAKTPGAWLRRLTDREN